MIEYFPQERTSLEEISKHQWLAEELDLTTSPSENFGSENSSFHSLASQCINRGTGPLGTFIYPSDFEIELLNLTAYKFDLRELTLIEPEKISEVFDVLKKYYEVDIKEEEPDS